MALFRRRTAAPPPAPPVLAPGGPIPVMPRAGRPGSVTDTQLDALEAERFQPPAPLARLQDLSDEEAASILAALAYLRAAVRQITGEDAPTAIENQLLATVLGDEAHAASAVRWQAGGQPLPLRDTALFGRLKQVVLGFWQPAGPAGA